MLVSSIGYVNKKSFNEFLNFNKNQIKIDGSKFGHISDIQISELNNQEKNLKKNNQNNMHLSKELQKQSLNMLA